MCCTLQLASVPVSKVYAGRYLSVATGGPSIVFVWGGAIGKNLGLSDANADVFVPIPLPGMMGQSIKTVAITDSTATYLTDSGYVLLY